MERLATSDISVHVGQTVIEPSDRVRDLGVILDSLMSMRQHIASPRSRRPGSFIFGDFAISVNYSTKTTVIVWCVLSL